MASLAAALISSLEDADDAAFDRFTQQLSTDEREALIAEFGLRARKPDTSAATLLRPLLRSPALRLSAAREAIRLMRAEVLSGRAAFICLSELRVAILRYWECRSGALLLADGAAEADATLPARARLDELQRLCDDVLGALLPAASASSPAAELPSP